jgi:hypothetical protein
MIYCDKKWDVEQSKYNFSFKVDSSSDIANLPTATEKKSGYTEAAYGSTAIDMTTGDLYYNRTAGWNKV